MLRVMPALWRMAGATDSQVPHSSIIGYLCKVVDEASSLYYFVVEPKALIVTGIKDYRPPVSEGADSVVSV